MKLLGILFAFPIYMVANSQTLDTTAILRKDSIYYSLLKKIIIEDCLEIHSSFDSIVQKQLNGTIYPGKFTNTILDLHYKDGKIPKITSRGASKDCTLKTEYYFRNGYSIFVSHTKTFLKNIPRKQARDSIGIPSWVVKLYIHDRELKDVEHERLEVVVLKKIPGETNLSFIIEDLIPAITFVERLIEVGGSLPKYYKD